MGEAEAAEVLLNQYRRARRAWRRFTGKPVRRFRRGSRRTIRRKGEGKGKGKGHRGFFFTRDE
eukprot:1958672-Lingulodinium_polyedra.AAC.1